MTWDSPVTRWRNAIQRLEEGDDDAFGKDMKDGRKWFDRFRGILLDDANCVGRTIDAFRYLVNSDRGGKVFRREHLCS